MNQAGLVNNALKHLKDIRFINTAIKSLPVEANKGVESRSVNI